MTGSALRQRPEGLGLRWEVWSRAFYAVLFAAGASLGPFLVLRYERLGLSGAEVGLLTGLSPLVSVVGTSFWGLVADVTRSHARLFRFSIAGVVILALVLSAARRFAVLLPLVALFAFCRTPIVPLMDHSVVEALGERQRQYGKIRLWGAVGWGVAGPAMGWLVDAVGLSAPFFGYAALMGCLFIISLRLPISSAGIGQRWGRGVVTMFSDRRWLAFLVTVLLAGTSLSVVHIYLFLYLDRLGATSRLMGAALSVATVGEVVVFALSERMLARLGTRGTLVVALGAHVARVIAYAVIREPWMVLPVQLLHGLSFSAMWVACVSLAGEIAPQGLGTTAQGVLNSVFFGLGGAIAGVGGGVISERMGFGVLFLLAAAAGIIGLSLAFATGRRAADDGTQPAVDTTTIEGRT